LAEAAVNVRQAAEAFSDMRETLTTSSTRNEEAAKAQLEATQGNERVAEQFNRIGEGLPEIPGKPWRTLHELLGPLVAQSLNSETFWRDNQPSRTNWMKHALIQKPSEVNFY